MVKKPSDIVDEGTDERALRNDVLSGLEQRQYPGRLDWLARYVEQNGRYILNPFKSNETLLTGYSVSQVITEPYIEGLRALVGQTGSVGTLDNAVDIGDVVTAYTGLVSGLQNVDTEIPPGEVLGRLLVRDLQRSTKDVRRAAEGFTPEAATPRELLQQLATSPAAAEAVDDLIDDVGDATSLPERLGQVQLATRLWDHQRRGLAKWLDADGEGYVDMATATGKTVLGLAAVGYCTGSGSLHPKDRDWLTDWFDGDPPDVANTLADDVLIVTTDDLLGAQWSRLFEQHCHTPQEYTQIVDGSISLPWGDIEIRPANALSGLDPTDYRLAIFDEVHNYSRSGGWGEQLRRFVESSCPVLALTGSDTEALSSLTEETVFEEVFEYSHDEALRDGVIPEFDWTLSFVPVDTEASSTLDSLRETAEIFDSAVDAEPGELSLRDSVRRDLSDTAAEAMSGAFDSPRALASALRDAGDEGRAPTDELETLASGLAGRRTHWWNLRPGFDAVETRVTDAMAAERPTLVLTQSYGEAEALATRLDDVGAETVVQLERGTDADTQAEKIESFDAAETGRKLLIGPGNRIGTGIDVRTVEVGINLARPGTGVNASLVQRLGRLLRKTEGTDSVEFYHVLGLPPSAATIDVDGADFVDDVTEFFSQVELPSTDGMTKHPDVSVSEAARESVIELERAGARWHSEAASLDSITAAYVERIRESGTDPAVETDWYPSASRWGAGVGDAVAGTVVTDGGELPAGSITLTVVSPADAGDATVTISGSGSHGICSAAMGDRVQFDGLDPGEYRVVASTDDSVQYRDVRVDSEPEPIRFDGGKQ
jgi:superfamily II DNA or RNA helicase